jgi:Uncharacterized protein conserved in bacteria (DUF2066)
MGMLKTIIWIWLVALVSPAFAAGPVETSVFAVQGVAVDVTDTNAAIAKQKALIAAQMKAIVVLAEKLGNAGVGIELAKLTEKEVVPLLKSLSIEQEKISPGRYEGILTVRFLPEKIRPIFNRYGIEMPASQGQAMLVLPVWSPAAGAPATLWDDNPWRKAWLSLDAQQAQIPIIIPLGDADDAAILTALDAINNDPVKLEALRRRYDVKTLLVAFAEPAEGGGIHARMIGKSPLGKMTFDKIYTADSGTDTDSAILAAQRFHQVMLDKHKSDQVKVAAATAEKQAAAGPQTVMITIAFDSPTQWNGLRAKVLAAPGVLALNLSSLDVGGAAAKLTFSGVIDDMVGNFQAVGLQFSHASGAWVIQAK